VDEAETAPEAPQAPEPPPVASTSHTATRAVGPPTASGAAQSSLLTWALVGLGLITLVGFALVMRARSKVPAIPDSLPPSGRPPAETIWRCPKCGESYAPGTAFCGNDGSKLGPS
jgi:hypothetical protein